MQACTAGEGSISVDEANMDVLLKIKCGAECLGAWKGMAMKERVPSEIRRQAQSKYKGIQNGKNTNQTYHITQKRTRLLFAFLE
jgi:hypothetical protein